MTVITKKPSIKPGPKPPVKPLVKPAPVKAAVQEEELQEDPQEEVEPEEETTVQPTAPKKMVAKKPTATISTEQVNNTDQKTIASTEMQEEALETVMIEEPHATVGVTMGMSRNLGNYESFKFQIHLSIPCEPTEEAIDAAYSMGKDWVDQRVNSMQAEIDEQLSTDA